MYRAPKALPVPRHGAPYNARVIPIDTKPGPFDLRFRLFGTPVRVKVSFWIFMALFGYPTLQEGLGYLFVWIFCGFVSVLCHEMGHIVAGRSFGWPGTVILYAFGGGAVGEYGRAERWQRVVIAASGPGAGFALYVALYFGLPPLNAYLLPRLPIEAQGLVSAAMFDLLFMNLFWNLLN